MKQLDTTPTTTPEQDCDEYALEMLWLQDEAAISAMEAQAIYRESVQ